MNTLLTPSHHEQRRSGAGEQQNADSTFPRTLWELKNAEFVICSLETLIGSFHYDKLHQDSDVTTRSQELK